MKRIVSIVLVLALAAGILALSGCGSSDTVTINVYNWGLNIADGSDGYIDTDSGEYMENNDAGWDYSDAYYDDYDPWSDPGDGWDDYAYDDEGWGDYF